MAREIYDNFIMEELLTHTYVCIATNEIIILKKMKEVTEVS